MKSLLSLALALGVAAASSASAAGWRLDEGRSALNFQYTEAGRPQDGAFARLTAEGDFDVDNLDQARLVMTVDVSSLDLGDALKSSFALTEDWFDADQHPKAVFVLSGLRRTDGDNFTATGELKIKGVSQLVEADIQITPAGDRVRVTGTMPLDRSAFGVGVGLTDRMLKLSQIVNLQFELEATAAQ